MDNLVLDAILGSVIPLINFFAIIAVIARLQVLRRDIIFAQKMLDERTKVFAEIYSELKRLEGKIDLCPVLDEHKVKNGRN